MSTSSSSSSNSGPNRFRGDAASFSPGQPPYFGYQQHPHQQYLPQHSQLSPQQQQQQQQMYMQYAAAAPQFPVMVNQMVYPQMYMPVYSDMYYPNQPYMVPQPVPFSPTSSHLNSTYRPKNNNYKRYNPKLAANFVPEKDQTPEPTPDPEDPPSSNENLRSIDTNSNSPKHDNINNNETNEPTNEPNVADDEKAGSPAPTPDDSVVSIENNDHIPIEPFISYPHFINTTQESYTRAKSQHPFPGALSKGSQWADLNSRDLIAIQTNDIRIINHNTNSSVVTNIKPAASSDRSASASDSSAPTSNWASFLQTTASTKKEPKKAAPSSASASATPTATSASSATSTAPTTANGVGPDSFNIKNEPVQPLGTLLLKIMFDPNYSVIHAHNSLPSFKINPRGLTNTGNICYMNSILQVLLYCQPFNKLLKLIEEKSIGSLSKVSKTPLLDATLQFFNEFVTKSPEEGAKTSSLSPENFYMNLISHEKFQHLKWGQQEDAEEFLGYYLDGLNDEFLQTMKGLSTSSVDSLIQAFSTEHAGETEKIERFKYDVKSTIKLIKNEGTSGADESSNAEDGDEWNEVGSNNKKISVKRTVEIEPTPITMIFGGQFKSVLTIPKTPGATQFSKSITLDPYQHVQLDISEASSIDEALLNLNKLEKISYKTKENKEISIKKQTFVDKLPCILIIHLKRFSFLKEKDVGIEKLRKKVQYEHQLHVSHEIISSKNSRDEDNQYRLIGVVYHHGSSAQGGHYTSDVLRESDAEADKKPGHEWIRIDDTQLKPVTENEVINGGVEENIKNAYILLYERLD